jgi:hypothetical protein
MTTAVDRNVATALRDEDPKFAAQNAVDAAFDRRALVAAAPVFAELIAAPRAANDSWVHSRGNRNRCRLELSCVHLLRFQDTLDR